MKTIKTCYGITVMLYDDGSGSVVSDLCKEFASRDESIMFDVVESLILAHARAGVDITSPEYREGIESTVNNIGTLT